MKMAGSGPMDLARTKTDTNTIEPLIQMPV